MLAGDPGPQWPTRVSACEASALPLSYAPCEARYYAVFAARAVTPAGVEQGWGRAVPSSARGFESPWATGSLRVSVNLDEENWIIDASSERPDGGSARDIWFLGSSQLTMSVIPAFCSGETWEQCAADWRAERITQGELAAWTAVGRRIS